MKRLGTNRWREEEELPQRERERYVAEKTDGDREKGGGR